MRTPGIVRLLESTDIGSLLLQSHRGTRACYGGFRLSTGKWLPTVLRRAVWESEKQRTTITTPRQRKSNK